MGRKGKSGMSASIRGLRDNTNFNAFVRENMDNDEFMEFGSENGMKAVRELWYETRAESELSNLHEMSKEDAIDAVRDAISGSTLDGWFRDADSRYKPRLIDSVMSNPGTLNAGMNIAYHNYLDSNPSNPMSFNKWLRTPQTMYRGDAGQRTIDADIFLSFTPDRKTAEGFGSNITTRQIRPIDTWGSFQTTGEQEFLIPVKRRGKR